MYNCRSIRFAVAARTDGMDGTWESDRLVKSREMSDGAGENLMEGPTQLVLGDAEGVEFGNTLLRNDNRGHE